MTTGRFSIGVAQIGPRLGDVAHNLGLYEEQVRRARERGHDLIVFPELSLTGYALRDLVPSVAVRRDGPQVKRLAALSRDIAIVAGLVEEADDCRFFNAAVYFDRGEIGHVHRKVYLPTYGMFDEQRYFARGDRVRAFDTRLGRLAVLVCEDLWHPSTGYLAALDGATTILCPSSSPIRGVSEGAAVDDNARFWEMLNAFYAQTFGLYVVYANRVGFEDGVGFWGGSEVVDPFGVRVAKARYYEPDVIAAEIAHGAVRRKRLAAPLLRDEDLDLTINELLRIRGRSAGDARSAAAAPAPVAGSTNRPRTAAAAPRRTGVARRARKRAPGARGRRR
jgi:predicted amidohydrolase